MFWAVDASRQRGKRWPVNASSRPDPARLQPKFVHPGAEKKRMAGSFFNGKTEVLDVRGIGSRKRTTPKGQEINPAVKQK